MTADIWKPVALTNTANQLPEALVYDLLDHDVYARLLRRPRALGEELAAESAKRLVVIDGIQKLPILLDEVQRLIDKQGQRFLLTSRVSCPRPMLFEWWATDPGSAALTLHETHFTYLSHP